MLSSSAFAEEIMMKCMTKNIMENETTFFKFDKSFFQKNAFQRKDGNWINLSSNQDLMQYEVGDLSASFLVRKKDNWWFGIVLDFETREIQIKSCESERCEDGKLWAKGSEPCE
jgi:hypothetical protein